MPRKKIGYDWRLYEFSLEELDIRLNPSFESEKMPAESKGDADVGLGMKATNRRRL